MKHQNCKTAEDNKNHATSTFPTKNEYFKLEPELEVKGNQILQLIQQARAVSEMTNR